MKLDVWGLEASPYLLRMEALLNSNNVPFRRLPRDGGRWENIATAWRLSRARKQRRVQRYPAMDSLDEYPEVPYLITNDGDFQYDSTAVAHWLDDRFPSNTPFYPDDPMLNLLPVLLTRHSMSTVYTWCTTSVGYARRLTLPCQR